MPPNQPMVSLNPIAISLRSIQAEAEEKIAYTLRPAEFAKESFLARCEGTFADSDMAEIRKTLGYAESLRSRDPYHPSMRAYFAHPVRVATFVLRLAAHPSLQPTVMGLIHNVFEVSGLQEQDLIDAGFNRRVTEGIRLLTIERAKQYDPVYLTTFYRNIEEFGSELMLVKCVDRLDNLFGFDLIERNDRLAQYLDLSEQFVVPMAERLAPDFGQYLHEVISYMRASECNQDLRLKYELFMKQSVGDEKES